MKHDSLPADGQMIRVCIVDKHALCCAQTLAYIVYYSTLSAYCPGHGTLCCIFITGVKKVKVARTRLVTL